MPLLHNTYLSQQTHDDLIFTLKDMLGFNSTSDAIEHIIDLGIAAAQAEIAAAKADAANAQPSV